MAEKNLSFYGHSRRRSMPSPAHTATARPRPGGPGPRPLDHNTPVQFNCRMLLEITLPPARRIASPPTTTTIQPCPPALPCPALPCPAEASSSAGYSAGNHKRNKLQSRTDEASPKNVKTMWPEVSPIKRIDPVRYGSSNRCRIDFGIDDSSILSPKRDNHFNVELRSSDDVFDEISTNTYFLTGRAAVLVRDVGMATIEKHLTAKILFDENNSTTKRCRKCRKSPQRQVLSGSLFVSNTDPETTLWRTLPVL